ncbi:DUF2933 domain-containing protein [Alicyclobacillus acidiphilus]|uniref:DUF2933 domain-containing protein n=1 Tax=Alicyclobacillus acidiphilus TaxID=182455 RepID=UPI000835EFBE|nr:DUF2933 domain-containing protein [Alicyclobacillus acidiphilus]MCL6444457.1 DUF2933 domain-containing protein [Alicyclobacillus sp.]
MLQTIGTVVALLACPLMMAFMMKGMHGGHDGNSMQGAPKRKFNSKEEEMADLRVRLEELQMQYDRLAKEIQADSASHHNSDHYRQAHSN